MSEVDYAEMSIRLKIMLEAVLETNSTVKAIQHCARPYADGGDIAWGSGTITSEKFFERSEEDLFNEVRLYEALGKDDARTVLGVWRRFREMCELITLATKGVEGK